MHAGMVLARGAEGFAPHPHRYVFPPAYRSVGFARHTLPPPSTALHPTYAPLHLAHRESAVACCAGYIGCLAGKHRGLAAPNAQSVRAGSGAPGVGQVADPEV